MTIAGIKTLSVIVPVYFNAESLWELYERLSAVETKIAARNMRMELIFIDDGSRDNSFEILLAIKHLRPQTKIIRLTRNFGEIAATSTGFIYATGDCVLVLAADLQNPPEQIPAMLDAWEEGYNIVFSYRRSREDPFFTHLWAAFYYRLVHVLVVEGYPKGGTDSIFFDKSLLPYVRALGRGVNYSLYLFSLGFKAKLIPYDRQERRHGKSRWTFKKKFFYCLDTLLGFSATPLRLVSAIGLITLIASLIYGMEVIFYAVHKGVEVPGFATLAVLISFSTGIIVMMLSMIGEYIWRIFELVSNHPKSIISEILLDEDMPEIRNLPVYGEASK